MTDLLNYLNTLPKPWKILAPMVGNSEKPYRILALKHNADLVYTEMVNCKAFNKNRCDPKNNQWYTTGDRPLVIQICGDNVEEMVKTCLTVQDYCDAIDINFGCPQEIAKKGHYGSFLQDEWDLIERIVTGCSQAINIPLFCKIRIFESVEKTVEYAKMYERAGCSLLAVHGRVREQKGINSGLASWEHIRAVKEALKIPVIANGNLIYNKNIKECYEFTKADGVMIAEPHLYNPCIFCEEPKNSLEILEEFLEILRSDIKTFSKDNNNISAGSNDTLINSDNNTNNNISVNIASAGSNDTLSNSDNNITAGVLTSDIKVTACDTKTTNVDNIFYGGLKSHAFKILNTIFVKLPDLRAKLDKSKCLQDYFNFLDFLKQLLKDGAIDNEDLILKPYIRAVPK